MCFCRQVCLRGAGTARRRLHDVVQMRSYVAGIPLDPCRCHGYPSPTQSGSNATGRRFSAVMKLFSLALGAVCLLSGLADARVVRNSDLHLGTVVSVLA